MSLALLLAYAGVVVVVYLLVMIVFSDYATLCSHVMNNQLVANAAILVLFAFVFSSVGALSVRPAQLATTPMV